MATNPLQDYVRPLTIECSQCGVHQNSENILQLQTDRTYRICKDCYSKVKINAVYGNFFTCRNCNKLVTGSDRVDIYTESDERFVSCRNCLPVFSPRRTPINNNYYTNKKDQLDTLGFTIGIELETISTGKPVKTCSESVTYNVGAKSDGSIRGLGTEWITTPTNNNNTYEVVKELCSYLNTNGFVANDSCGFHLHIGSNKEFTKDNLYKIYLTYNIFKNALLKTVHPSRENNTYCKTNLFSLSTTKMLLNEWCPENDVKYSVLAREFTRYSFVNFASLAKYGTIEIRVHEGTTDFNSVINWVRINTQLVRFAISKSFEELLNYTGSSKEFKSDILIFEDLINYYEGRVKAYGKQEHNSSTAAIKTVGNAVRKLVTPYKTREYNYLTNKYVYKEVAPKYTISSVYEPLQKVFNSKNLNTVKKSNKTKILEV